MNKKISKRLLALFILFSTFQLCYAQDSKEVTGRVVDATSRKPLAEVSVSVKSTKMGTKTNAKGEFSLKLPLSGGGGNSLIFSALGYVTQELNADTYLDVQLVSEDKNLEEIVVVGYGTQKKVNLTGAVAFVDSKVLESRPITNLGQGLQGVVPNLNISPGGGRPGQGSSFNIRGTTSINGGSPLVLVDGVAMDPNLINPNDVESVTVLKDASSAAIYGVRGAFGVILITSKKGKKNTGLRVDYNGSFTFTRPTRLPEQTSGLKYMEMFMLADETGAISGGERGSNPFTPLDLENARKYVANPTPENAVYVDPANPNRYRYVGNTNWVKEMYPGWAPQNQHTISVSGGTDKTTYLGSFGYFNQKGILKAANQDFNRFNINFELNSDLNRWLSINGKMTLNREDDNSPTSSIIGSLERLSVDLRPIMPIRHPDGNFSGQASFTNPFQVLSLNGRNITSKNDLWLTGGLTLKPLKNVTIIGNYTWNTYDKNNKSNTKNFNYYGVNGVDLGLYPWTNPARVFNSSESDRYVALNGHAQYENTFAQKHYFKAMVGYNQELKQTNGFGANVKNLINQEFPYLGLNNDNKPNVYASAGEYAVSGQFFRLNYIYNEKYLLEVNGRYDGTSRFARGNRYVFQPSVSAGWRISKEKFFTPLSAVINDFKVRASYGTLGNQATEALYPYISTLNYGLSSYLFGNEQQTAVLAPGLVSANFTWENVTTTNMGIDFSLLNRRLTGSFDYYIRDTKDMIVSGQPLPSVLGTSVPSRNAADLRNKGFELSLGWRDKIGADFNYDVTIALSDYSASITKYNLNPTNLLNNYIVGQQLGNIWGFTTEGFYASDAAAAAVDNTQIWGGTWLAGDIKYRDWDGDGKITRGNSTLQNPGDLTLIGNSTPRYQYSLNLGMSYKAFDLTLFVQGIGKRDMMLGGPYFWGFTDQWSVPTTAQEDYWTPENTNAYFPRLRFGGGNFQTQTKYLQSVAYLRMKQMTLGYNLPSKFAQKIKVNRLRIYLTGQNLFEFTKLFKTYDPEQFDRANDYPINRGYSLGLQLSL